MTKRGIQILVTLFIIGFIIGLFIGKRIVDRKVSIFVNSIESISKQQNVTFAQAADMVYDLGYRGVDTWTTTPKDELRILDSIGFAHACTISYIDFCNSDCESEMDSTFSFMKRNSYDKLLLVPGCYKEKPTKEQKDSVITKVRHFSDRAASLGLNVLIEDYDDVCSPCMTSEDLDYFFSSCPNLGNVFDSGNYPYCNEDEIEALKHFLPRIKHIHFKDRKSTGTKDMVTIGTGIVRFDQIKKILDDSDYDGWITVEIVGDDIYTDAKNSIKHIE